MALKAQISRSKSRDDMCTAIHIFRDLLGLGLHLPRPAAVETKQALKDAARESIMVQDVLFASDCEGVQVGPRISNHLSHVFHECFMIFSPSSF